MPRKDERVAYINEVVLEWASGKREARITDLSSGGCYVDTIATIPEGESLSFSVQFADGESIALTGDVAYVMPGFGFGIKFTDLSAETKAVLDRLIKNAA
ncbi:MAG: PilZ domain-containing protein [Acidobacteriota bacterium]